jgi:hypothetical protein
MSSNLKNANIKIDYVNAPEDIDEYATTYGNAWTNPLQAVGKLTFPHLGENTPAGKAALEDFKNELKEFFGRDESDHWGKFTDITTGKTVGGGRWNFFTENPYRAPQAEFKATQFHDGSEKKDLAESMYKQLLVHRPKMMPVPHACKSHILSVSTTQTSMDQLSL